jgi:DNA processing protein
MRRETALRWWHLNILNRKRYELLKEAFGDLDIALDRVDAQMLRGLGVRADTLPQVLERHAQFDLQQAEERMTALHLSLCSIEDNDYPSRLKEIADPPVFLSSIGDLSVLRHPCVGIVGTRRMSPYGRSIVEAFVPMIVRSGCVTVSGLALGVDAAAARETLGAGGKTVAVLGHGLSSVYPPANRRLAEKIVEGGGVLLSEYPPDLEPDIYTFPARNRIIAGLSLGTLVVEAPEGSGAVITAKLALDYGRDVFAVSGLAFDDNMAGCHRLISDGHARLVTRPEEILRDLGIVHTPGESQRSLFAPQSAAQEAVYAVLSGMPQSADDIALRTGLAAATVAAALTLMELAGAVRSVGGGMWIRK